MDKLMPDIKNWGCGNYKLTSAHAAKQNMLWVVGLTNLGCGDYKLRSVHATKHVMGCGD